MTAMTIQSMNELFHHALQDIYYAENQIAKTLSDMMDQATDAALVDNFEHHLEDTHEQIKRLEQVFRALGQSPKGVTCQAILGLIEESQETLREIEDERVRDAAILASAHQLGRTIGADQTALGGLEIVDLLQLTLDEEKNQDSRLTALAESRIN